MGAASGLLAALLFVVAGIVFLLGADPGGTPQWPSVAHADLSPAYLASYISEIRVSVLLTVLGLTMFLWFLATLWGVLKGAEGEDGRGSTLALIGGVSASITCLAGLTLISAAALSTSPGQADTVPTLYTAASLLIALSGGLLSIFFFGVAKVVFATRVLPKSLGVLAVVAALLSICGFMTPFFEASVLNAANGALGRIAWDVAFVVWLGVASAVMTMRQRRQQRADSSGAAT